MTSIITVSCLSGNLLNVKGNAYLGLGSKGIFINQSINSSIMNYYEVWTTSTLQWPFTNTSGVRTLASSGDITPLMFVRIGFMVTILQLPVNRSGFTAWSVYLNRNSTVPKSDVIPDRFKPSFDQYIPVTIIENSTYQGMITISVSDGKFNGPFNTNGTGIYCAAEGTYTILFGGHSYYTSN